MMRLSEAAAALGASYTGSDVRFQSVSSDTRTIAPGALFVALSGERFDGHDYVAAARSAGAVAALVEDGARSKLAGIPMPMLWVQHARSALAALAGEWRRRFRCPVVAIVGSNGKTTTKEMTAAILRAGLGADAVLATAGNLNNDIGLPLTVLRLRPEHRAAVFEIGMNHPGETAILARVACPTVGVINNAQREHQEFMASVEAVAEEHAALLDAMPADGVAVLNADDPHFGFWKQRAAPRPTVSFGLGKTADVQAEILASQPASGGTVIDILIGGEHVQASLRIPGAHNVRNALAAAAAGAQSGVSVPAIGAGLSAFEPARGRLQLKQGRGRALLIDDTYNANPDSVRAAIDVLAGTGAETILVLGDMGEVGADGGPFHVEAGSYARERGIGRLLALGEATRETVHAFGQQAEHFESVEPLLVRLEGLLGPGVAVLVKGSRFMRMERVIDALVETPAET